MKRIIALLLVAALVSPVTAFAANGNGYNNGYENGNYNGYQNGNGYENGYTNGYPNGNGYENGYTNGYPNGNGYENGYTNGYSNGNGYENGYINGNLLNDNQASFPTASEVYIEDDSTIKLDGETFNITAQTPIIDAETGQAASLADANGKTKAYIYDGTVKVVLVNVKQGTTPPQFGIVEKVDRTADYVTVTVRGGSLLVTIPQDSYIQPFLTRNIVTTYDIHEGSHLLMWYPMVTASYPGLATAQRTVILNRVEAPYVPYERNLPHYQVPEATEYPTIAPPTAQPANNLSETLASLSAEFYTVNNITMAPLRPIAEAMGFTVTWNEHTRSVNLTHPNQAPASLALHQITFEGRILESAPTIRNDRTFVPLSFFEILLSR